MPAGTARGEKYPGSGDEWWNGWNFGLTYNDAEYTYAHILPRCTLIMA